MFRITSLPWYTCDAGSCSLPCPAQTTRNEWWLRSLLVIIWIAKVAQAENEANVAPRTSTDVVMGTPRYMAPEQCRGGVQIDDKADVYSMGIMLYETSASVANHETLVPLEPPVSHVQESQGMTL